MGYYTYCNIDVIRDDPALTDKEYKQLCDSFAKDVYKAIFEKDMVLEENEDAMEFLGDNTYELEWYDCDENMTKIAQKYPQLEIVVYGESEERDDVRKNYYHGEYCQRYIQKYYWEEIQ